MDLLATLKLWHLVLVLIMVTIGIVGATVGGWKLVQWRLRLVEKRLNSQENNKKQHEHEHDCIETDLSGIKISVGKKRLRR